MVGFHQNDAGEFLTILFDLLHKCLECMIKITIGGSIVSKIIMVKLLLIA